MVLARRLGPWGAAVPRPVASCRPDARACVVRVRAGAPRRLRYRAVLRLDGRALRASRPRVVA